jgi:hypothetical protein
MSVTETFSTNIVTHTADTPQLLLEHHLKELRLPTILREYDKVARQSRYTQTSARIKPRNPNIGTEVCERAGERPHIRYFWINDLLRRKSVWGSTESKKVVLYSPIL